MPGPGGNSEGVSQLDPLFSPYFRPRPAAAGESRKAPAFSSSDQYGPVHLLTHYVTFDILTGQDGGLQP